MWTTTMGRPRQSRQRLRSSLSHAAAWQLHGLQRCCYMYLRRAPAPVKVVGHPKHILVCGLEHQFYWMDTWNWLLWFGCHEFYFPINIGLLIIPIDELIFFRGVAQPPTRYRSSLLRGNQTWLENPAISKVEWSKLPWP